MSHWKRVSWGSSLLGVIALALAGCSTADKPATESMLAALKVRSESNGSMLVTGPMPSIFADKHLECAAAKHAQAQGYTHLVLVDSRVDIMKHSPKHRGRYRFVATGGAVAARTATDVMTLPREEPWEIKATMSSGSPKFSRLPVAPPSPPRGEPVADWIARSCSG